MSAKKIFFFFLWEKTTNRQTKANVLPILLLWLHFISLVGIKREKLNKTNINMCMNRETKNMENKKKIKTQNNNNNNRNNKNKQLVLCKRISVCARSTHQNNVKTKRMKTTQLKWECNELTWMLSIAEGFQGNRLITIDGRRCSHIAFACLRMNHKLLFCHDVLPFLYCSICLCVWVSTLVCNQNFIWCFQ